MVDSFHAGGCRQMESCAGSFGKYLAPSLSRDHLIHQKFLHNLLHRSWEFISKLL